MKRLLIAGLAGLVAGCASAPQPSELPCPDAGTAEGTVCAFYTRYLEVRPSGLPTPEQQAALAPWLSDRLERRMDAARAAQTAFRARHPGEKPPLVDGCLFASLFEGPTSFTVGTAARAGAITRVPVRFRYSTDAQWQDVVILTREGERFVVDDVELTGAGPFNPAGRLSEALESTGE